MSTVRFQSNGLSHITVGGTKTYNAENGCFIVAESHALIFRKLGMKEIAMPDEPKEIEEEEQDEEPRNLMGIMGW